MFVPPAVNNFIADSRNIGQVTDHVCDGVHDPLSGPVHVVCVALQLRDEGVIHRVLICNDISHVFQVPRDLRPQPRLVPSGVSGCTDGRTCCARQP